MNRSRIVGAALAGALLVTAGGSTTATAVGAKADPAYKILKQLDYRGPGRAALRLGYYTAASDKGFGWTKVKNKHNITKYSAVEYIAKSPNRRHIGGQSYRESGYAGKYACGRGVCRLVKQYKVLLTVNEKKLRDGHDKGVITQYCVGIVRCPNWVTTALAKANAKAVAVSGAERYVGGYEPFASAVRAPERDLRYVGSYGRLS
ncbi:hypothetical protein ACFV0C_37595 [Streptomyces sp. NPDC059568]|uniref:hypothetical protein n=1 Tax=unclassified Streptomyces TaxID=2593676 RepID=UPI0036617F81